MIKAGLQGGMSYVSLYNESSRGHGVCKNIVTAINLNNLNYKMSKSCLFIFIAIEMIWYYSSGRTKKQNTVFLHIIQLQ